MENFVEFEIKRSLFDNLKRKLIITPHSLEFQNKDTIENATTILKKEEIVAYRYGIRWISFQITYGREYQIFVQDKNGKTLKLNFKSIFGKNKNVYHHKFNQILDVLWDNYFSQISGNYIQKFRSGEDFDLCNIHFAQQFIEIEVPGIIKGKKHQIAWSDVNTHNYQTYFMVYSDKNPTDISTMYKYRDDWNIAILYSVLRTILRDMNNNS